MKKMLMVAAIALLVGVGAVYAAETEGPAGVDPHVIYEFCPSRPYVPRPEPPPPRPECPCCNWVPRPWSADGF